MGARRVAFAIASAAAECARVRGVGGRVVTIAREPSWFSIRVLGVILTIDVSARVPVTLHVIDRTRHDRVSIEAASDFMRVMVLDAEGDTPFHAEASW